MPLLYQCSSLIGCVFVDDVCLCILVLSESKEDDIILVNPDLLLELSTHVALSGLSITAIGLDTTVSKDLQNLGVLCSAEKKKRSTGFSM